MAEDWTRKLAGKFLVIDGPDGAGKSTQTALLAGFLRGRGVAVREVRDPGGTAVGERIRAILLDRTHGDMAVECELMLFMASRAQLAAEVIRPALAAGQCVLADRYISSTIAYQGASGASPEAVRQAGRIAVGAAWPDLTIILDVPADLGLARAGKTSGPDRVEAKCLDFHVRVRDSFLRQAEEDPGHFAVVDGTRAVSAVHEAVCQAVQRWVRGDA